jgi:hypothetical protein
VPCAGCGQLGATGRGRVGRRRPRRLLRLALTAELGRVEHVLLADAATDARALQARQVDAVLGRQLADERA